MPVNYVDKIEYADRLVPLLRAIAHKLEGMTILQVSEITGMPNWKIGRILSRGISAPSYIDMTKLIVFAGISLNDAASIVGLYTEDESAANDNEQITAQGQALLTRLRICGLDTASQERLLKQFDLLITAEQLAQRERSQEEPGDGDEVVNH